jgi:UDP-N-acetylglucosamine--N-acetylmuramyl-(pentapeptide) pyrophosphoryl-undecaprenol N-acetylglucosamine transferase
MSKKILIAAGGTGGHLFPAQALAQELLEGDVQVFFSGAGLATNRYFDRSQFSFEEVSSATLFRGKIFKAIWGIVKGIKQSFRVIRDFQPDVVVGFGSFHSFPLLCAAVCKRIPIILFESNSIPGKVNRLLSRWAVLSAVHFPLAARFLKGRTVEVKMPLWKRGEEPEGKQAARDYFSLDANKLTFLVFGGSQGAVSINQHFCAAAKQLASGKSAFQVLHLAGNAEQAEVVRESYAEAGIQACVKTFEERMSFAWKAADLVICRAGASTLAELIAYEVPGILIPYPHAADDHQRKNAAFMHTQVGGALRLDDPQDLLPLIEGMLVQGRLQQMSSLIRAFKNRPQQDNLCSLVREQL